MTTRKVTSPKTASPTVRHPDIRLRKIRSLKTSALQAPKIAVSAARVSQAKPSIKSVVPYGLVIGSLILSGAMASEANAASVHTKTAKAAHTVTHVVRRHAVPVRQIDPVAQFFEGLFGGAPIVRTARGHAGEGYVADSPTYDTSMPVTNNDAQAASDAEVQAIQQLNDENALNASMQAAEEQNDEANAATLQTEINAGM